MQKKDRFDFLKWEEISKEKILHTPVFDIWSKKEISRNGLTGDYVSISAPDWIVVIAVHEDNFVLVRQWRHGEWNMTLEFPGGVVDKDEDPKNAALRELEEETGFKAGKMTFLGKVSSNTALFSNHFSVFLAEDLVQTGSQNTDEDEFIHWEEMPRNEVISKFGDSEFTHAYMGTALAFYLRHIGKAFF